MKPLFALCAVVAAAVVLSACGSSGSSGASSGSADTSHSPLSFAAFQSFSGPDASFGPEQIAGCAPATQAIAAAGGVLNHKQASCSAVDDRGDPADAVPAAESLIATNSNLVGVLGPGSNEAPPTIPLFNRAQIPMFSDSGQGLYSTNRLKYFWRITPADDAVGYAMALWAHERGYKRVASVFGQSIGAQGSAPTVTAGFKKLGGTVSTAQLIALDQSSYRTEVSTLAAGHPQAIFIELDPQTAATFISELVQLYHPIPIIGTDGTTQPPWLKAVSGVLGKQAFAKYYVGAQPYAPTTGPAHQLWLSQLHAAASSVTKPLTQWENDSFSEAAWDSINIMSLAMLLAKHANPVVWNSYIPKVTNPGAGHVIVHDFAEGKRAILAGKPITYVGATGPVTFDRFQNSPGQFEIVDSTGKTLKTYTAGDLQAAK
jgi:ABC-type branched-subunit amino acid transport system substrate-binding protein